MPLKITKDISIKLFSLLVAVLLFMFVGVESSTAVDAKFALEYRTTDDMMVTSRPPRYVTVTMRGPWVGFRAFDDLPAIQIDLREMEPGTVQRTIEVRDLRTPAGMTIISIQPTTIDLSLDRRIEKWVAVEVVPEGRLEFGYEIAEVRTEPTQVRVVGPASKMNTLDFVHTRPVILTDKNSNLSVFVELRPPAPPLRLVEQRPIQVFVEIREEVLQRNLEMTVTAKDAPKGLRINPKKILLTLKGPRLLVDRIDRNELQALVELSPPVAGQRKFEAAVTIEPALPERVQIMGELPSVEVNLPRIRRRR